MKSILFVPILFLFAGCMPRYIEPPAGTSSASLHFKSNHIGSFTGNFYNSFESPDCKGQRKIAGFTWATGSEKSIKAFPNQRVYLQFGFMITGPIPKSSTLRMRTNYCVNIASFIPEENHFYEITQTLDDDGCNPSVIDKSLNMAPKSLVVHDPNIDSCMLAGTVKPK